MTTPSTQPTPPTPSTPPTPPTEPPHGPGAADENRARELARDIVARAVEVRATVAVAESLTAGLVSGTLASVPGASQVLRGGVVAYATELKATLLDVDEALLAEGGAVQADVALAMADGVAARLGADFGVATTGVAGPDPQDGHPPGTVFVAVHAPRARQVLGRSGDTSLPGDRDQVRWGTVVLALELLDALLAGHPGGGGPEEVGGVGR